MILNKIKQIFYNFTSPIKSKKLQDYIDDGGKIMYKKIDPMYIENKKKSTSLNVFQLYLIYNNNIYTISTDLLLTKTNLVYIYELKDFLYTEELLNSIDKTWDIYHLKSFKDVDSYVYFEGVNNPRFQLEVQEEDYRGFFIKNLFITFINKELFFLNMPNYIFSKRESQIYKELIKITGINDNSFLFDKQNNINDFINKITKIDFANINPYKLATLLYTILEHAYRLECLEEITEAIYTIKSTDSTAYYTLIELTKLLLEEDDSYILKTDNRKFNIFKNPIFLKYYSIISNDLDLIIFYKMAFERDTHRLKLTNFNDIKNEVFTKKAFDFFNDYEYFLKYHKNNIISDFVFASFIQSYIETILSNPILIQKTLNYILNDISVFHNKTLQFNENNYIYNNITVIKEKDRKISSFNIKNIEDSIVSYYSDFLLSLLVFSNNKKVFYQDNLQKNPILYITTDKYKFYFVKTPKGYRQYKSYKVIGDINKKNYHQEDYIYDINLSLTTIFSINKNLIIDNFIFKYNDEFKFIKHLYNKNELIQLFKNSNLYDMKSIINLYQSMYINIEDLIDIKNKDLIINKYKKNKKQYMYISLFYNLAHYKFLNNILHTITDKDIKQYRKDLF